MVSRIAGPESQGNPVCGLLKSLARESSSAMTCPSLEVAKYASEGRKMIEAKETTEFLDLGDTVGVQQFKIPRCSMELD